RTDDETIATTGTNFPGNQLETVNSAAVSEGFNTSTANSLVSWTSRVNYGYNNKYLVTLSGRVDGSSRFGFENKYGFFPAASVAWRISQDLPAISAINDLKLRFGVGVNGNNGIGNFASRNLFGVAAFNGLPAVVPNQLGDSELRWERTTSYNLGVDFIVVDERISGSMEVYTSETTDLLLGVPLSRTSGFTQITQNVGSVENRGIEATINSINVSARNFQWTTSLNIALNRNEVLKLNNDDERILSGFASVITEGQPVGAFFGFKTNGLVRTQEQLDALNAGAPDGVYVNAQTEIGDVLFVDVNGDGEITGDDQTIIGDANPDFYGGFTNIFSYKNFEVSTFLQFAYGNDIYNNGQSFYEDPGSTFGQSRVAFENRFTPNNPNTNVPRAHRLDPNGNGRDSDRFIDDGSYIRLKNVTISYNLPSSVLQRIKLRNVRIHATAQNLLTFTGYDGLDPEVNTFSGGNTALGTDFFTFPQARTYAVGINIGI
ncbi:MAG: SusC/RagA family TonB-linked outer membrane protein, partial [Bacteroidota bacterium]